MSDNPYQSPQSDLQVAGVLSGRPEDLRAVARYQKGVLVCLLLQIGLYVAQFAAPKMPASVALPLAGLALLTWVTGALCAVLLAMKVYNVGIGILLGILPLVPCVNLIILLMVNGKATNVLKSNGIHVGLMGANLAEVAAATNRR